MILQTFGETFIEDDMFLAIAFSIASVANAIARIGWGYFSDKTSFQVVISRLISEKTIIIFTDCIYNCVMFSYSTVTNTTVSANWWFMCISVMGELLENEQFSLIQLTMLFMCMAATHALFITATVRCFGTRYKATNYGCLIFSTVNTKYFIC